MFSALRWQAPSICQAGPACWMDSVFLTPYSRRAEVLRLLEKGLSSEGRNSISLWGTECMRRNWTRRRSRNQEVVLSRLHGKPHKWPLKHQGHQTPSGKGQGTCGSLPTSQGHSSSTMLKVRFPPLWG